MAQPSNTFDSYDAVGIREDLSDVIYNISPEETPFYTKCRKTTARNTFVEVDGVVQPAPAPRFSRTPSAIQRPPAERGENTQEALTDWGFAQSELDALKAAGAIA